MSANQVKRQGPRTPSAGMEGALLSAAANLLESEGAESLSVRRIATAAKVAPMGVYNHFESKFGIVEALFIQGFELLKADLSHIAEIHDPYEALLEATRRYRASALAHPMRYKLMFMKAVSGFEPSTEALQISKGAFDGLVAVVKRAMSAHVIVESSPIETTTMIWATIHGWVSLELLEMGFMEDKEASFNRLCHSMLQGLRP